MSILRRCSRGMLASAALLCCLNSPAQAVTEKLRPIVVTPSRMAQTANQSLASVSVITHADIEREQPHDVLDLLQQVPGVEISRQGGYGKLSSLFLRGTNSDQVLVLVDGVPMGSVTSGTASWEFIPVDEIQRIEVVRGPLSSLYGANAAGGVIQIFTRTARHRREADAQVMGGSYGTADAHVGGGLVHDRTHLRADASIFHTDGFNARDKVGGIYQPDADGYQNKAVSLSLSQGLRRRDQASLQFLRAQGYTDFDPTYSLSGANHTDFVQQVASAKYRMGLGTSNTLTLRVGQSQDWRDTYHQPSGSAHARFDSTYNHASVMETWVPGRIGTFNVGADYLQGRLDSTTAYNRNSRITRGVFGEYTTRFGRQDIQLSLRHDQDDAFGGYTTGSAAWGLRLTPHYKLTASYGTAFTAPTFNDLYYPGYSNPDLQPEKSHSAEIGLRGDHDWGRWRISVYQTKIRDLITLSPAPYYLPMNLQHARIRGVESEWHKRLGAWRLGAGATYLQPINRDTGMDLPRRPRTSAHLDVDWRHRAWRLGGSLLANGHAYDDTANTRRLAGYALVDLRLAYRISRTLTAKLKLHNVLDRHYETVYGYHTAGASAYLTLAWQFARE